MNSAMVRAVYGFNPAAPAKPPSTNEGANRVFHPGPFGLGGGNVILPFGRSHPMNSAMVWAV